MFQRDMENILEKIHKAALKFLVPLSVEEIYAVIGEEAVKLVGGEHSTIYVARDGGLERVYASHPDLFRIGANKTDLRYRVFKKRKPEVLNLKFMKDLKKKHPFMGEVYDRSAVLIPLSYRNKSVGLLSVMALKNTIFTKKEMDILALFGSLASIAIRKTQLYDEVKQALETRDMFISMAAHELRTPLTTITGYAQRLKRHLKDQESTEAKWAGELYRESLRLKELIHELLTIDRIKSGQLDYIFHEHSLREILQRLINAFVISHPDRKIVFHDQIEKGSDIIIGDINKLLQVFTNIIGNAIKYSPTDTEVTVTLKNKNGYLVTLIKDEGGGIAKEDLPRIFENYYKGSNSKEESLGIGLYLAKNIIDRHNGEIKIRSKPNKGALMQVILPKGRRSLTDAIP